MNPHRTAAGPLKGKRRLLRVGGVKPAAVGTADSVPPSADPSSVSNLFLLYMSV